MKITVIVICFLTTGLAGAQSVYNQSIISIGSTSVFYVKDSLVNDGMIVNNGDLQVGGSWINHNQYEAGQGQITFNGHLPQIINHNDQSFSKLTVSGGGEKLFLANITIENKLNLSDGVLVSKNNARIIFNNTAEIFGGSDHSHIKGAVYHKGPGSKIFPLGNGSLYLPVQLLNVEGSSAEIGMRPVELDEVILQPSSSLNAISTNRYWELDLISGSLANSAVILPVSGESIVNHTDDVVVAQAQTITDNFENLGQFQFDGSVHNGKVTSKDFVTMPFIAVATASDDGSLIVYNAVSANGDSENAFLRIGNIENYPENNFSLFNRWGDKIFEIENYDNQERVFRGKSNIDNEKDLVNGTYFYVIETKKGALRVNGFLTLKN